MPASSQQSVAAAITLVGFLFLVACATKAGPRALSQKEMNQFNLNGIINGARICPMKLSDAGQGLTVSGRCEIVDCQQINGKISCQAELEK